MSYSVFSLTETQMNEQANNVMELLEKQLYRDGLITDPNLLSRNYTITLVKKASVSDWFKKHFLGHVTDQGGVFVVFKNAITNPDEPKE